MRGLAATVRSACRLVNSADSGSMDPDRAGLTTSQTVVVARVWPSGSPSQCDWSITHDPRVMARGWVASQPPPSTLRAWMLTGHHQPGRGGFAAGLGWCCFLVVAAERPRGQAERRCSGVSVDLVSCFFYFFSLAYLLAYLMNI